MKFINRKDKTEWNDNGGLDGRMIFFKHGKEGLYEFDLRDSVMTFKEILPIKFDSIYLLNGKVIVNKNGQKEFLDHYLQNKNRRFKKISCENATYLRYKKTNDTEGWISNEGVLFDDM